jgi:hypothetical protein
LTQTTSHNDAPGAGVDLAEVARLVEQLEKDLALARAGARDLQTLRDEVERLRDALAASHAGDQQVHAGLQGLRERFSAIGDELFDDAVTASRYAAWIGKLLGL